MSCLDRKPLTTSLSSSPPHASCGVSNRCLNHSDLAHTLFLYLLLHACNSNSRYMQQSPPIPPFDKLAAIIQAGTWVLCAAGRKVNAALIIFSPDFEIIMTQA
ncbi:hypothetical protein PGT21_027249 [Puccinia graminis f. sp. tritici]|uniref:Uncharacterized protein n=1 Tax=Puccinia graminis f. sp. tritici TaxID=56615 RepID=A0A5B0N1V1_PUCGR|nr:hypothetical protein PGT21_027249 [Puccinia graminis f. sp. tritici]